MASVSLWIVGIVGICFIAIIIEIFLPEGKINKSVKMVLSYAVVFVVVSPLVSFLKNGLDLNFNSITINVQDGYLYNLNQAKLDALKVDIENNLKSIGFNGVEISISADVFQEEMEIFAIYVDLYNLVISDKAVNKNIVTEVESVVSNYIKLPKEKIVFYE